MANHRYQQLYEEIMRRAEEQMRERAQRVLEERQAELQKFNVKLNSLQLNTADQTECVIEQLDIEIANLASSRDRTSSMTKRVDLKAAIVHLRETRDRILRDQRKPPESGIAVPAEPPKGPMPKQGGAQAPLHFER